MMAYRQKKSFANVFRIYRNENVDKSHRDGRAVTDQLMTETFSGWSFKENDNSRKLQKM